MAPGYVTGSTKVILNDDYRKPLMKTEDLSKMSCAKKLSLKECERPSVQITDMDTVQEENGDSDESTHSDLERLRERTKLMLGAPLGESAPAHHSQPNSRRMSSDMDAKLLNNLNNNRRPSAIIAAFRRPSQALALCAATQRRFLSEVMPRSSRGSTGSDHHPPPPSHADILGHEALSKALSALYAKLLVVLGLAFPVTEVIATGVSDGYYQGFYLYLYTTSVLFVLFQYATLVRQKAVTSIIHEYAEHETADPKKDKVGNGQAKPPKERISRYGSFYLRLGAIAFGIGSMVYSGLEFGEYFEMTERCRAVLAALTPAVRMALTLLQMQFIFLNSKEIESCPHKMVQRFGFMHMIATNLCEWLYVIVEETKHEIHHLDHAAKELHKGNHNASEWATLVTPVPCHRANMMGTLLQNASPFLFPCTIEYSLICAVILYEMWKEVKCTPEEIEKKIHPQPSKTTSRNNSVTPEKILQQFAGMLGVGSVERGAALHQFSVDCSHAHRGLFAGILLIVMTIISLIMFFVLAHNKDRIGEAIYEVNIVELILYSISLLSTLVALKKMRCLTYKRKGNDVLGLDTSLLMLAQTGMFIYCMFSIIGCHHAHNDISDAGFTALFSELMSLIQTIVQSLFIIDAWWRRSCTPEHRATKPGRQLVTFLLVLNMAMWAVNTLEKNRAEFRPEHLVFYGKWAWTIITHVSMPLAIFYRFHSTICLFEIWKNCYKSKPIYLNI